jgi:tryptophan synthase alpha chain
MPFVTAGFPSSGAMPGILSMLKDGGADCLELGVPFSDPIADGATIQRASAAALEGGMTMRGSLATAEAAARIGHRVVLMSYANPLMQTGRAALGRSLASAGVAGLLVPDLPLEEAGEWREALRASGVALALFAAPTTPPARLRMIDATTDAFIYYVSLAGVTGERRSLAPGLAGRLGSVRRSVASPVCVGFGVSSPSQAGAVSRSADGVIIGSALVRRLAEWGHKTSERRATARWIASVARAVRAG